MTGREGYYPPRVMVLAGTGMGWENPTHSIPMWNHIRLQLEEELKQAELLEQEERRAEELHRQGEERVLQEQERWHRELMAHKKEERRQKELARTLAREQWLAGEKRRKDEARIRGTGGGRKRATAVGEGEGGGGG